MHGHGASLKSISQDQCSMKYSVAITSLDKEVWVLRYLECDLQGGENRFLWACPLGSVRRENSQRWDRGKDYTGFRVRFHLSGQRV